MLVLVQAAAEKIPPIYVTVQQPASAFPEWVKILVSAGVGAVLGMLSSVVMEYWKPHIGRLSTRKSVASRLGNELMGNLAVIESCVGICMDAAEKADEQAKRRALDAFGMTYLQDKWLEYYLKENGDIVYDIDPGMKLVYLYDTAKRDVAAAVGKKDFWKIRFLLETMAEIGKKYVADHKLRYKRPETTYCDVIYEKGLNRLDD
jgi:hypothetical protein